ncbi:ATP-binding protein [Streptomyces kunmingensis]|uniref:ATP-binding protein n=1 Tax=Streptomyces kunmingensis TaxID=68225 RepID=A0ABU6CIU6_9ACTN|nr:ATP-binding protein [Streptomyces kunmingensis]MEB3964645.1 ATP-binding protein [Streptomyces kunmingensis]
MPHSLGWYHTPTPTGFVLHLTATPDHLRGTRTLIAKSLAGAGVGEDLAHSVQLVMSELCGNAIRACGDFVPLVAEVEVESPLWRNTGGEQAVWVRLHDPYQYVLPARGGVQLNDPEAESGRGLPLMDLLAPGWRVAPTPVGKQVRCRIAGD